MKIQCAASFFENTQTNEALSATSCLGEGHFLRFSLRFFPNRCAAIFHHEIFAVNLNLLFEVTMDNDTHGLRDQKGWCPRWSISLSHPPKKRNLRKLSEPLLPFPDLYDFVRRWWQYLALLIGSRWRISQSLHMGAVSWSRHWYIA
jgi:hypothetical protein